jgi:hypothetical protein
MEPFDSIEKLITEHGSAAILKERIKFAADQYAALERKSVEADVRNANLQAENQTLKAQLDECRNQIEAFRCCGIPPEDAAQCGGG